MQKKYELVEREKTQQQIEFENRTTELTRQMTDAFTEKITELEERLTQFEKRNMTLEADHEKCDCNNCDCNGERAEQATYEHSPNTSNFKTGAVAIDDTNDCEWCQ